MVFGPSPGGHFGQPVSHLNNNNNNRRNTHVCGLYYLDTTQNYPSLGSHSYPRRYLPMLSQSVHARIVASTSRSTLTQTFVNPSADASIPELRYTFPLYDGVSVVAFTCTVNKDRVIRGVVQETNTARRTYDNAVAKGKTAGILEQLPDASDVFTSSVANVPPAAEVAVEIEYLGELKHDAGVDGIRLTIPTTIAPRYGSYPGTLLDRPANLSAAQDGITIVVDAEVPAGSVIKSIQSPSHPIAVSIGSTSTTKADAAPSLQLASATLSLGTARLDRDFIVQVIATNTSNPVAVLETHPTIPHQQALMATLVPRFKMAATKPEVVFICDRSGSMQGTRMTDLRDALRVFLKSLPVGAMFNICSFGSEHSFLFDKSVTYDQNTLEAAMRHVDTFAADFGGTEIRQPIEQTFRRRHVDLDLEVFLLTDGEVWGEQGLFGLVGDHVRESKGAIRLFTLGVGRDVSHSLVEGVARAGNGFSQCVSHKEKMTGKVVRMLKGALTPHVTDYTLELKYADAESETEPEDDFDIVSTDDLLKPLDQGVVPPLVEPKKPISLFDDAASDGEDAGMDDAADDGTGTDRFSHISAVKPPKVLQAPFQISPFFPHSRNSVYLLLSPDRELRDKTPESLILRGTSTQGPLELRIPIAVLPDKGETIHQLAARKAVQELEEGRGWIYHAKSSKDGRLLSKVHPGRFPGMVEREAVRLGVQFQVGGKWCSFVAVDDLDNAVSVEDRELAADRARVQTTKRSSSKSKLYSKASTASASSSIHFGFPPADNSAPVPLCRKGMPAKRVMTRTPPLSSWTPMMFGSSALQSNSGSAFSSMSYTPPSRSVAFGGPSTGGGVFASAAVPDAEHFRSFAASDPVRPIAMQQNIAAADDGVECEESSSPKPATPPPPPPPAPAPAAASFPPDTASTTAKFEAIVSVQHSSGFWTYSDGLMSLLGVSERDLRPAVVDVVGNRFSPVLMLTVAVVAFLRKNLAHERDSWEMMEEKAMAWLNTELGDKTGDVMDAVKRFF
ncbi:Putative von Willebrand factor, type A, VIT domain, von Willebrand factor A-like domain superfamily [Colletotrichum destructivum]|uniref:von Willebrand factor, type A, VIT domain, von Willebrand factor A-like domain superfamily n=1 Tax=Colletotrichum destructivum TaxID=34406 RepID=A0AAX4I799_9PEZI|nr:Putative von Willebrand factor, type A, VIT domain, von Willebrand factor A-like domain superfamily [Colletotrichum destructivum]